MEFRDSNWQRGPIFFFGPIAQTVAFSVIRRKTVKKRLRATLARVKVMLIASL